MFWLEMVQVYGPTGSRTSSSLSTFSSAMLSLCAVLTKQVNTVETSHAFTQIFMKTDIFTVLLFKSVSLHKHTLSRSLSVFFPQADLFRHTHTHTHNYDITVCWHVAVCRTGVRIALWGGQGFHICRLGPAQTAERHGWTLGEIFKGRTEKMDWEKEMWRHAEARCCFREVR